MVTIPLSGPALPSGEPKCSRIMLETPHFPRSCVHKTAIFDPDVDLGQVFDGQQWIFDVP
jgi:hypothetical protein